MPCIPGLTTGGGSVGVRGQFGDGSLCGDLLCLEASR